MPVGKGPAWDTPAQIDGLPAKNWTTREGVTMRGTFSACVKRWLELVLPTATTPPSGGGRTRMGSGALGNGPISWAFCCATGRRRKWGHTSRWSTSRIGSRMTTIRAAATWTNTGGLLRL